MYVFMCICIHVCGIISLFPFHTVGVRTHIAFVKAGLQSKFYVNGKVDAVLQSSSLVQYLRQDLVLGGDYRSNDGYLTGAMETIKVFGSSLSDADILALYLGIVARTIPTYQSGVSSPTQCAVKADSENTQAIVFGLQNGVDCWTGDSVSSAISLSSVSNCPLLGSNLANQVYVRKYCFPGWTTVSSYTGNVLTLACRQCSKGHYCPGDNTENPCAMDYSTEGNMGYPECIECDTANGYSTVGLTGQSQCVHIPNGYYYIFGDTKFIYCGTNPDNQHWIGGGYDKKSCRCAPHWTGDVCDLPTCPDQLPSVSLGTLLFNSDSTLIQAPNLRDTANSLRYLHNLLSVTIDVNGDGVLSTSEMLNYLKTRSVSAIGMLNMPLWYDPEGISHSIYSVQDLYTEATLFYQISPKHKFDGSGLTIIQNLTSTYPSASWDNSKCETYDFSRPNHKYVETSWNFTKGYTIQRVCGYINGDISSKFQTNKILFGNQTYFTDTSLISSADSYKRVYCIYVYYLNSGKSMEGFECSVGLFYVSV